MLIVRSESQPGLLDRYLLSQSSQDVENLLATPNSLVGLPEVSLLQSIPLDQSSLAAAHQLATTTQLHTATKALSGRFLASQNFAHIPLILLLHKKDQTTWLSLMVFLVLVARVVGRRGMPPCPPAPPGGSGPPASQLAVDSSRQPATSSRSNSSCSPNNP